MMEKTNLREIIFEMDGLWGMFNNCRAFFPYMNRRAIGHNFVGTAPYYVRQGFEVIFQFNQPLIEPDITRINEIGHWINQSFILRLYAMLEYFQMVSEQIKIDQTLAGWQEVDLLRRLRGVFAHKTGKYNPADKEERRLV